MTEDIKNKLLMCAEIYHRADFIQSDPVQFPHRYTLKQDIEVSGLLTAIMSFGNRKQILKKADELHGLMGDSPYQYVLSCQWEKDFPSGATNSFYRMLSYADFYGYFRRLYIAYTQFESLEEALSKLAEQNAGWRIEDLRALTPRVYDLDVPQVIFTDVRGSIAE